MHVCMYECIHAYMYVCILIATWGKNNFTFSSLITIITYCKTLKSAESRTCLCINRSGFCHGDLFRIETCCLNTKSSFYQCQMCSANIFLVISILPNYTTVRRKKRRKTCIDFMIWIENNWRMLLHICGKA